MQTRIWHHLRGEHKIYGMALPGVICGAVGCLLAMLFFGFMWSVGGAIPGYFIGDFLSKSLHDGRMGRFLYWYFPGFRKNKAPNTYLRKFF